MLLKLKDDYIVDILYESEANRGCPTCDYGSSYIREFWVVLQYRILYIRTEQMYDYLCSEDFLMRVMLRNMDKIRNMTRKEFIKFLTDTLNAGKEKDGERGDVFIALSRSWEQDRTLGNFESCIECRTKIVGVTAGEAAEFLNECQERSFNIGESYSYNRLNLPREKIKEFNGEEDFDFNGYFWLLE